MDYNLISVTPAPGEPIARAAEALADIWLHAGRLSPDFLDELAAVQLMNAMNSLNAACGQYQVPFSAFDAVLADVAPIES